ncbi:MAG: hypothetical protein H8D26_06355 [Methanomicrobia archaeon]|nr:hypothetical protein [Methanomicrobia archaeon]
MDNTITQVKSILPILVFMTPVAFSILIFAFFALGRTHRIFREGLALLGLLVTLGISIEICRRVVFGGEVLTAWSENLRVDGLSVLMELIGSFMGIIIVLYSIKYIVHEPFYVFSRVLQCEKTSHSDAPLTNWRQTYYYGLLILFLGMLNWTCATNNIIMMWVSMEATTLSVVFLVTFYWRRESMEAGYKYLLLVSVGVTFALLGCILIYCGAIPHLPGHRLLLLTEIGNIAKVIPESIVLIACAMFIVGFGAKAGLIPFHAWLPDAHAEAPVPISALLSGIVINIGAYALARTVTIFAPTYSSVVTFVAILASVSMVIGIIMALVQDDLKRLLAYSSISHIAYVIEGLGLGTYLGIYGGLYHLVNHTIIKALLFLCAGALMYSAGSRKISELRLVAIKMPVTGFCFLVGALAIGGMPPFNGFMSKFTLFLAAADKGLLWVAVIGIFTGLLTIACFAWTAYRIFWTKPQHASNPGTGVETPAYEAKEVPVSMWIGMVVLALLCIALGVYPRLIYPILDSATKCILSILGG